jgi:hypothetical protein
MRLRNTIIWLLCIVLAPILFFLAGSQLGSINSKRQQMKLISNEPLKNAPPSLAFATVAMGAFRGLVVDVLWMRADRLKDEGQFFDARQLAEWITVLQPRFPAVWQFQAWNMSYNIAVAIPATQPEERWRWVRNGYELLRDQGLELNPKSIGIYQELARIFHDKIGSVRDDVHKYYKLQLALAMEPLLGPADNQYFQALAGAPASWDEIIRDPCAADLVSSLKAADGAFADDKNFVNNYLTLRQYPARFKPAAFNTIDAYRNTKTLDKLDIFARAYYLRHTWKLEPRLMQQLNQKFGPVDFTDPNTHLPLDWRHPQSHALYWAMRGLEVAHKEKFSIDEINTDRMANYALQELFRGGKIFIYDVPPQAPSDTTSQTPQTGVEKEIFLRPDLRMFEPYNQSMLARIDKYEYLKEERTGSLESLKNSHRNMLKNALFSFYQAGHRDYAEKIYRQIAQLYPSEDTKAPFTIYVKRRLVEELRNITITNAEEIVLTMLRESYFRYAMRDDEMAQSLEQMAKEIHDTYEAAYPDDQRIPLPGLKLSRYMALIDFLNDQQYPLNMRLNLRARIRIERPDLAEQLERQEEEMLKQQSQSP